MAYVVTQSCCADASCVVACPVNCIHPAPGEPGFGSTEMVYVDANSCVGCGACATACPVGAMSPEASLTTPQLPFIALNASYYDAFPHADRAPVAVVPAQRRLSSAGPFRVAVIGAGPAGLYAADELLKHPEVEGVDVYDRLHTPYGLVRHGVAPDHPSTKQVTRLFESIERQPRFTYHLGVTVGEDVSLEELRENYHAVIYAVGAAADRELGIPGEHLAGSVAATDLVGWYNGHPDVQDLDIPLAHERAVVVGNGNVALDVARILTRPVATLERTDLAAWPLEQLRSSGVREVVVLGRRGPAQAAFNVPELIGLAALEDVDIVVEADPALLTGEDQRSRLLRELAERPTLPSSATDGERRRIVLAFTTSPVEVIADDAGRVAGVAVVTNQLRVDADGSVRAEASGETRIIETGLLVRSIGHRGRPVAGLPFDESTGTVPHEEGRVEPGLYVTGWIKRGPVGFIGTNKSCAQESVGSILDDLDAGLLDSPGSLVAAARLVAERCPQAHGLAGWQRIDATERERGARAGRSRIKLTDPAEQRAVAVAAPTARGGARRRSRLRRTVAPT